MAGAWVWNAEGWLGLCTAGIQRYKNKMHNKGTGKFFWNEVPEIRWTHLIFVRK